MPGENRRFTMAVTLINVFSVPRGKETEFVKWWQDVKENITAQQGFISGKFHRSIKPESRYNFINVAVSYPSADRARIFPEPSAELCSEHPLLRLNLKSVHVQHEKRQESKRQEMREKDRPSDQRKQKAKVHGIAAQTVDA